MSESVIHNFLVEQLQDLYDAEKQLVKALPKMAKASSNEDLKGAFEEHLEVTKGHVSRLEEAFSLLETAAKAKPCKAMKGLVEEGSEVAEETEGAERDLALIAAAQRVEHYEISAYGTAKTVAGELKLKEVADLLEQTEQEEVEADSGLSEIALALYQSIQESEDAENEGEGEQSHKQSATKHTARSSRAKATAAR